MICDTKLPFCINNSLEIVVTGEIRISLNYSYTKISVFFILIAMLSFFKTNYNVGHISLVLSGINRNTKDKTYLSVRKRGIACHEEHIKMC